MFKSRKLLLMTLAVLVAGLFAIGCPTPPTTTPPTSAPPVLPGVSAPVTVNVILSEFKVASSLTSFSVGVPYHFVVANQGQLAHEFMISPPAMAGMSMDMHKDALVTMKDSDLAPNATKTMDYTFTKAYSGSSLELACHISGHYEAGMRVPITAK